MRPIIPRLRRGGGGRSGESRGQSLPEFALILVPIMLLLLGATQFGIIWSTQVGVTNAVRDAARAASLVQPKNGDSAGTIDTTTESTYATTIMNGKLKPGLAAQVPFYSVSNLQSAMVCYKTFLDATSTPALQTTVTVTYGHAIIIPLLAGVLGSNSLATTSTITIPVGVTPPSVLPSVGTGGCSS